MSEANERQKWVDQARPAYVRVKAASAEYEAAYRAFDEVMWSAERAGFSLLRKEYEGD